MPETVVAAAPAQPAPDLTPAAPVTPAPTTAVEHAVQSGDFRSFREAKRAEAQGKPLEVPEPKAAEPKPGAPAAAASPERQVSKRQEQINGYERQLAELRAENQRLKSQPQPPPSAARAADADPRPAAAPAPPANPQKDHERYLAMVDAPKLTEFESLEQWTVATNVFVNRKMLEEHATAERQRSAGEQEATKQRERGQAVKARVDDVLKTDPTFWERVSPEISGLRTFAQLAPNEKPSGYNAIAEEIIDSPVAPQLMLHFSEHPDELHRLAALRDPRALVREFGRLQARFEKDAPAADLTPAPKTVSTAPAPPVTVGHRSNAAPADPIKAAVKSGDFRAFREAKRAELRARK